MVDDLKRQASEIYKERNKHGTIRTSDSLSLKKLTYVAVGLAVVVFIAIKFYGGFEPRPDPVKSAVMPAPLIKEEPTPEMLEPIEGDYSPDAPAVVDSQPESEPSAESAAFAKPAPAPAKPESIPESTAASTVNVSEKSRPKSTQVLSPVVDEETTVPAPAETTEEANTAEIPEEPKINEEETARRELARELVIQNSPSMAELILLPGNQDWRASPDGDDTYLLTFIIIEDTNPMRYVWRVNIVTKSVTPLSYYARKLS